MVALGAGDRVAVAPAAAGVAPAVPDVAWVPARVAAGVVPAVQAGAGVPARGAAGGAAVGAAVGSASSPQPAIRGNASNVIRRHRTIILDKILCDITILSPAFFKYPD